MSDYIYNNGELYHYGVLGMKWGIKRSNYKSGRRARLLKKASKYDLKSSKSKKLSDKYYSEKLGRRSKKILLKSDKFRTKSSKLMKKSLSELDEYKKLAMQNKAAKYKRKASKLDLEGNAIRRTTDYSGKAEKYASKSDKYTYKAAKVRSLLENDKRYIALTKKKISELTEEQKNGDYKFVKDMIEN